MAESNSLQQLLEQELKLLEELTNLSYQKTRALMKDDLTALDAIVLKEETLSQNLKKVDNACSPQVQFFLRGQSNPPPIAGAINDLIERIRAKVRELKLNNELNQELIRDSLGLIQFTLNSILSSNGYEGNIYDSSGKAGGSNTNHILDYKG
ncbi:MAG: flagellar protein FlgN [Firmicutes bacterium]|nr:flagellar protein FlgN [Bacillota bacterium]